MTRQRLSMKVKKQIKDLKEKKWKNKDIKHHLGLSKLDNDDVRGACELDYSKATNKDIRTFFLKNKSFDINLGQNKSVVLFEKKTRLFRPRLFMPITVSTLLLFFLI